MDLTPTQRLAEAALEREDRGLLADFVLERADLGVPGEAIARQLAEATNGEVEITGEAMRRWIRKFREAAAKDVA